MDLEGARRPIAQVWSEVLGIDDPGPADDFFLLGGQSAPVVLTPR